MATNEQSCKPAGQIRAGLIFLGIASLLKWVLDKNVSADWADGLVGMLYGLSIGFMLVGIWRNSRRRRTDDGRNRQNRRRR